MPKHAEDARGTRGNGQGAVKELESTYLNFHGNRPRAVKDLYSKYLNITNETICATQKALVTTSMAPGQDWHQRERAGGLHEPEYCINN